MKVLSIATMTLMEALRQPTGLVITFLITLLMFFAPTFSSFAMGSGNNLLRTNLLSTILIGSLIFISLTSHNIFYKEFSKGTIINILSKPISITNYYLGKYLGVIFTLTLFFLLINGSAIMSMTIGTPETASTQINYLPLITFGISLITLFTLAILLNYILNFHIIQFLFFGWFISLPIQFLIIYVMSPYIDYPLLETHALIEFIKASTGIYFISLIIGSFSIAMSSISGPVLNLTSSFLFLFLGLISRNLENQTSYPKLSEISQILPDFHIFWLAEMISIGRNIRLDYLAHSLIYALFLITAFICFGIAILNKKDFT